MKDHSIEEAVSHWSVAGLMEQRNEFAQEHAAIIARRDEIEPWALDKYDSGFSQGEMFAVRDATQSELEFAWRVRVSGGDAGMFRSMIGEVLVTDGRRWAQDRVYGHWAGGDPERLEHAFVEGWVDAMAAVRSEIRAHEAWQRSAA